MKRSPSLSSLLASLLAVPLALALCVAPPGARAAAIEVAPVSHEVAPGQTAISMTLSNRSGAETALQVRGYVWTQDGDRDDLVAADELLVAPAIFSLAPGASQVLRVRVPSAPAGREAAYRLLIDELPSADASSQVRMRLRLSIPVFAQGHGVGAARLLARIDEAGGLILVNQGERRVRVNELSMISADGRRLAVRPMAGPYLLAGSQRRWAVADADRAGAAAAARPRLMALTDDGSVEVPLVAVP